MKPDEITSVNVATEKYRLNHPVWYSVTRTTVFILSTLAVLLVYSFFIPQKETVGPVLFYLLLGAYVLLFLAWSANVLADKHKPEILKMVVSLFLIFMLCSLFYRFSGADWGKVANFFFNWEKMEGSWHVLISGLGVTLMLALISTVGMIVVGILVAVLRTFNNKTLNFIMTVYVDVFRSIPVIVIMVVSFFALPYLGISMSSMVTTVVALSLGYGAYASESFRAGIEAVALGQREAARALGLTKWQTMRLIIGPQTIPIIIPVVTGNIVAMIKDTAVASIVAAPELLKRARELYTAKTNPTPLVAAALIFLAVLIPLVRIVSVLERRMKR